MMFIKKSTAAAIADALENKGVTENIHGTDVAKLIMQLPPLKMIARRDYEYNEEKAQEVVDVANTYLNAVLGGRLHISYKAGYSVMHGVISDESGYIIQCSGFMGLILRGIPYEQSPYYTGDTGDILARTDLYSWANSDYEKAGITEANQLALYAYQTGCILNNTSLANIRKGDLLFFKKGNGQYLGSIWHVAMALEDGGATCVHALNGRESAIWTFNMAEPPALLGELLYIARPRYNTDYTADTGAKELKITQQPTDQSGAAGETAVFSVVAEGDGLTYVWQYSSNGTNWYQSGFDGWNTDTQPVEIQSWRSGQKYRCVITDVYGNTITSDAATLTMIS